MGSYFNMSINAINAVQFTGCELMTVNYDYLDHIQHKFYSQCKPNIKIS